ncbi:hypothetical protein C2U70_22380 [Bradyrhizobium guangdongense]|uniref:hypothetical protein n=1 Tax=Bradyrhizobium guangdongense TaxID=1325090 RepID=UPI00112C2DFB|nr:hypothetical protein [Bradyrhizobium guangdongense]TPQ32289.1 hypothetical protein C2U70_22380 [Bradyrhizobium guangdongense]
MKRLTKALLLAGGLVATTAVLASPVATSSTHASPTKSIHIGWDRTSRSDNTVDQTWWAVRTHCPWDTVAQRLFCTAVTYVLPTGATGNYFESKVSDETGLPLPERWDLTTAKNSPFISSIHAETPLDPASVLAFYRAELEKRGWTENGDAVIEPDRAVIAFKASGRPALLRVTREGDMTVADLSLRKVAEAKGGLQPKPGQVKLMFGNKTDEEAIITINGQTIKLAAKAGADLTDSAEDAAKVPASQTIDLPPGKYKVILKVTSGAAQNREFEVAANETWGLLVGPDGAALPIHLY